MYRRFQQIRSFSSETIIIRPKGLNNVEIGITTSARGRFEVKAYSGKRNRPDMYYSYRTMAERDASIERYINGLKASAEYKEQAKAKRVLTVNPVKVGDIFASSWGYDQTNVDFYQVVEVKGKSAVIRAICSSMVDGGQESGMSSNVVAVPDAFIEGREPITKRVQTWDGGNSLYLSVGNQNAYPWNGKPMYCSWYH